MLVSQRSRGQLAPDQILPSLANRRKESLGMTEKKNIHKKVKRTNIKKMMLDLVLSQM